MKKLIRSEFIRLKNNLMLIFVPLLIIMIFIVGYILCTNNVFGAITDYNSQTILLALYNFASQFLFLGLIYFFVSSFSRDFSKGVYAFLNAINYTLGKCLTAKTINLAVLSIVTTDLCIAIFNALLANTNIELFMMILVSLDLNILYTLFLCMLLSVCIKKTLPAVLACLGVYVVLDIINLFVGFIFQIADNSFTNYTLYQFIGMQKDSLVQYTNLDFEKYHWLYITVPSLAYICAMIVLVAIIVRVIQKKGLYDTRKHKF